MLAEATDGNAPGGAVTSPGCASISSAAAGAAAAPAARPGNDNGLQTTRASEGGAGTGGAASGCEKVAGDDATLPKAAGGACTVRGASASRHGKMEDGRSVRGSRCSQRRTRLLLQLRGGEVQRVQL